MNSEPCHSPCLWRWRQPQACDQCPQWSCPPGPSPCPLCLCIYLKLEYKSFVFLWTCVIDTHCVNLQNLQPAIMTIVQALGKPIPWLPGTRWRPFSEFSSASLILTWLTAKYHQTSYNEIIPVARGEEGQSQSWGWSRNLCCPFFESIKLRFLKIPIFPYQVKPFPSCLLIFG